MESPFFIQLGLILWGFISAVRPEGIDFSDGLHPMLYFGQTDLQQLRLQASYTHGKIADNIREAGYIFTSDYFKLMPPTDHSSFASVWNEHFGNNLCALAMCGVLHPENDRLHELLRTYMERMASYRDWYVVGTEGANLGPLGHSLTGFATAYDYLYDKLDTRRRKAYYDTIKTTTSSLQKMLVEEKFVWSNQYLHPNAVNNIFAIFLGALVVSAHEPRVAMHWIQTARERLDFVMEILSHIIDGTISEGLSYGSYTSRAITQYVYLAKRHLDTDHTDNPWLIEHMWFFYHTTMPGFQRTIGIADSNFNWLYGPESQILFLESNIMQTGHGNWIADRIRESKARFKPLVSSTAQAWTTLHTEFLFYNSSISVGNSETRPKMHIFSDWGVVTYGGAQDMKMGNTYLSFKSGTPSGEAVHDLIFSDKYPGKINGWKNFNPGHEHPDQNSFVFAPNGRYFVSESLHGPKHTYLDNAIVFSPSDSSACNQPWEGQIGECGTWLNYKLYSEDASGEILDAQTSGDMAFICGEAAGVYSKSLQVSSVFRGILLLNPEVLIVLDTIRLQPYSKTKKASALFHNIWNEFEPYKYLGYEGARMHYPEGSYTMFSMRPSRKENDYFSTAIYNGVKPAGLRDGPTNYINVTFSLDDPVTNVVHVFYGPTYEVNSIEFLPTNEDSGISLSLVVNDLKYTVNLANVLSSRQDPVYTMRKSVTKFGGFAHVEAYDRSHYFGLDPGKGLLGRPYLIEGYLTEKELKNLPETAYFTSLFETVKDPIIIRDASSSITTEIVPAVDPGKLRVQWGFSCGLSWIPSLNFTPAILLLVAILQFILIYILLVRERSRQGRYFRWSLYSRIFATLFIGMVALNVLCIDSGGRNACFRSPQNKTSNLEPVTNPPIEDSSVHFVDKLITRSMPTNPLIFVTSLPGFGGDLLEKVFEDSSMVLYLRGSDMEIPLESRHAKEMDLCLWTKRNYEERLSTVGWFKSLKSGPTMLFNQILDLNAGYLYHKRSRKFQKAPVVFNDDTGFWTMKLPWISEVIGKNDFQSVFLVRDPRSWIHMLLSNVKSEKLVMNMIETLESSEQLCSRDGHSVPLYYSQLKTLMKDRDEPPGDIEKLSILWTVTTGTVLANAAKTSKQNDWPMYIVRFEDLLTEPETAIKDLSSNLGLPLGVKSLNKLIRIAKSGKYSVEYDGLVKPETATEWKKGLSDYDLKNIEKICCKMMKILGYECNF